MGTRDKIWTVLPHPGLHAKCLLGQEESPSSQTYISAQTLSSLPLASPVPAGEDLPQRRGSGDSHAQSSDTAKGLARPGAPFLRWGGWGTGTWPRSPQGQGWERDPGVLTRAFTCSLPLPQDTHGQPGRGQPPRAPHPLARGMPWGTPRSLARAGAAPSPRPFLCPPSRRAGAAGSRRARTLVLLRTSPTKVETSRDPGMEVRGRRSL